jgi:glycosyltransferase involved in cell wall biosynthesis
VKILLLAPQPFFLDRGTPIAVRAVAQSLAAAGHAVDLLTFHGGRDEAMPGVRHIRAARPPMVRDVPVGLSWQKLLCSLALFATAIRLLRQERHDCIHAVEDSVFLALALRLMRRTRLVYDMDSIMSDQIIEKWPALRPLGRAMRALERVAMRGSDLILSVCPALAQRAAEDAPATPCVVLHDFPLWDANATAPRIRDAGDGRIVALYVGNLQHYQGVDLLLQAAAMLPRHSAIDIVVVGGLTEDARRSGDGRVRFLGPMPLAQLPGLLVQADVLVSPRLHGVNTPMKVYSYMMAGRPILATAILSHTQVLDEGCALLVQPTSEAVATGLLALERDAGLRQLLGAAARERVETRYSHARFEEILHGAYAGLEPGAQASPSMRRATA